ncbi:CrcB protein [Microbacteriaceae bacterium SG_E_30_P1]|uniref:Fluoride-specific ion channel FluC n=1 Tax=Antiquaquibacter oligotrophicus TaxID=2880260 RepID=A0ABT6KRC8_9MICO|nr:CrcB family protein [Antiquaquibacter oligotrophicus]MDH6182535.1 CrcB protein [Antiquaquibacter oligotrophicus]UDF14496.1 CrcB family protein [Antiquaquibacter oligotrophicus]
MRELLAVIAGGVVGTGLRLAVDALLVHGDAGFPWSTLVVNVVGAFTLGLLVARLWPSAPGWLRAGLGAGLLGSFTTFSALAVSLVAMTTAGNGMLALAYLVASVVLGLAAAWAGLRLGRPRGPVTIDEVDE